MVRQRMKLSKLSIQLSMLLFVFLFFDIEAKSSALKGIKIGHCTVTTNGATVSMSDKDVLKYWMTKQLNEYGIYDSASTLYFNIYYSGFFDDDGVLHFHYVASVDDGSTNMPRTYYYISSKNGYAGKYRLDDNAEATIGMATKEFIKIWVRANSTD